MERGFWWSAVLISGLLGGIAGAALMFGLSQAFGGNNNAGTVHPASASSSSAARNGVDAASIYSQVAPSIVTIDTQTVTRRQRDEGEGTGIVLDTRGHILTNFHVVDGAGQIQVTLPGSAQTYDARVAAQDQDHDLAVISITAPSNMLHPAVFGDPTKLHVGDPVLALGNPLGYEKSLTEGIISGLDRTFDDGSGGPTLQHLIQEDAAINPGNSGGPLLDARGEVIGVNTLLDNADGSDDFAGLGFAIPITTATNVMSQAGAAR